MINIKITVKLNILFILCFILFCIGLYVFIKFYISISEPTPSSSIFIGGVGLLLSIIACFGMLGISVKKARLNGRLTKAQSTKVKKVISSNEHIRDLVEKKRESQSYLTQQDYVDLGVDDAYDDLYRQEATALLKAIVLKGTGRKLLKNIEIKGLSVVVPLYEQDLKRKDAYLKCSGVFGLLLFAVVAFLFADILSLVVHKSLVFPILLGLLSIVWLGTCVLLITADLFSLTLKRVIPLDSYTAIGQLCEIDAVSYDYVVSVYNQGRVLCETDCEKMQISQKAEFLTGQIV